MNNEAATVFIVDDDPDMRTSLQSLMESAGLPSVAYASASEFLAEFDRERPGCLLLDLRMPGMTGIELIENLRSRRVQMPILMLSGHGDISTAVECMKLGVVDFLEKPVGRHVLLPKIREAVQRARTLQQSRAEASEIRRRLEALTAREQDVLRLLVAGRSSKQIAFDLGIALRTAINHRAHVMSKTQARNTAELVRMYLRAGGQGDPEQKQGGSHK